MTEISMRLMLECGVHFGHQTRYWSPKMAPFIYGRRNKIHIINLERSLPMFKAAADHLRQVAAGGGTVMFVGTKRQAGAAVREQAERCGMPFVSHRWLGGMLTNYKTVRKSIDRLKDLDHKLDGGEAGRLSKNERLRMKRERDKLENSLAGIKNMEDLPDCLFVVDVEVEYIAVREANKLGIPVVAVVDTNCSPDGVDHVIPGNDDAVSAIRLYLQGMADAVLEGRAIAEREAALTPQPQPDMPPAPPPPVAREPATAVAAPQPVVAPPEPVTPPPSAEPAEAETVVAPPRAEPTAPQPVVTPPEPVTPPPSAETAEAETVVAPPKVEPTAPATVTEPAPAVDETVAPAAPRAKKKKAVKKKAAAKKKKTVTKAKVARKKTAKKKTAAAKKEEKS